MIRPDKWKISLELFFAGRAQEVVGNPALEDLCYISGRDTRLWSQVGIYEDLIRSILDLARIGKESSVLEVGCASGFIAKGLSPHVDKYIGVDLASETLAVARRLALPNAEFTLVDGSCLPFDDSSFDAAFCYDVVTNFPEFTPIAESVSEMWRVVRPGGRVLVGSVPDETQKEQYVKRVAEVDKELNRKQGPPASAQKPPGTARSVALRLKRWITGVDPVIVCYYFCVDDFLEFGRKLGARTEISDIHLLNPYRGCRFNAVYEKPLR